MTRVLIVDEFTGRIMPGRRYPTVTHQAIEAKEHVKVKREVRRWHPLPSRISLTYSIKVWYDRYGSH